MTNEFFDHPILNSPYDLPIRHWELDHGQPTQRSIEQRRTAEYITPLPKPKKRKGRSEQTSLLLDDDQGFSTQEQEFQKTAAIINAVRLEVAKWRVLPNPNTWHVTPENARLLQHWRHHNYIDFLEADAGQVRVKINGVDVFHPNTGEVRSDGADGIVCWFIDTDYNMESFFVRHAYFLGANDPYKSLKTTLKAEINIEAWASLNSDTSRPFNKPTSGRIAVKVINHLGDEVMKVFKVG
ncbi:MAG: hypothetical protein WC216_06825 [Gallionella sp.]|jgi:hypothetical protein